VTGPLLLDTCAVIWMGENDDLSDQAIAALDDADDRAEQVTLSPISAWEIGMLASKGRFASPLPPQAWFNKFMTEGNFRLSGLSPDVLIASSFLPGAPPNDPIDRIIIATARAENLRLVTRDRAILAYGAAGHVNVIEC
jgi:PIN domain nuclease of toxin-antitoxin system